MPSTIERYHEAVERLDALIEAAPAQTDTGRAAVQRRATLRMGRLRRFLALLGDPHQGYPIVHVGGTSGKGSTSTTIAAILTAAGYRTGLHTSPYLQTPAEKLQLDGRLIAPDQFVDLVDEMMGAHNRWRAGGEDTLTYGEVWLALTALFYTRNAVDVAVLEVGAGGRFDLTNIVEPALSVITSVGIDHTNTLGETIADIAWHKAGIIKRGVPAITAVTDPVALAIIEREADAVGAPLRRLDLATAIGGIETGRKGTAWTEAATGERFRGRMAGSFQARNGAVAVAAARRLREAGLDIPGGAIHEGLARARIPGRAEFVDDTVAVLLDGAHNPDKVAALANDLPYLLPVERGRRVVVLGVLDSKQATAMIGRLVPEMDTLVATAPRVLAKEPRDAGAIAQLARDAGFTGTIHVAGRPADALAIAQDEAGSGRAGGLVITGSLYLIGNVREHWYREEAIVSARSPWPGDTSTHLLPARGYDHIVTP
jgi:dihydrofolate synthase/folylpolyglutamate synthase